MPVPDRVSRIAWAPALRRAACALAAACLTSAVAPAQEPPLLHITVWVTGEGQQRVPVARHVLFISDDPVSAAPRRVVTSAAGTAEIRLRPGNYTVESDRPFLLGGQAFEWIRPFTVGAAGDATLELTPANATVAAATPELLRDRASASGTPAEKASAVLTTWQASVFEVWTPHRHAAGFLVDARGLIATSLGAIDDATSVEVQVSSSLKVAGAVTVADAANDVALVRVHATAVDGIRPVPLACGAGTPAPDPADRYLIEAPMFGAKDVESSLVLSADAAGGPVLSGDGRAIGLSSTPRGDMSRRLVDVRVVDAARICAALDAARLKLDAAVAPDRTPLPVEPQNTPSAGAAARNSAAFNLSSYQASTSDFDLTFITPAVIVGAEARRGFTGGGRDGLSGLRVATDFGNWSDYVEGAPSLLYVRATPRLVEGFWMKVARGAASTQGADIPPIKRLRPGFSTMQVRCGGTGITPIHPFRIQARVTETEAIEEGFYVFDPSAISTCSALSVVISSVKDPDKTETRTIDRALVRRIAADFQP